MNRRALRLLETCSAVAVALPLLLGLAGCGASEGTNVPGGPTGNGGTGGTGPGSSIDPKSGKLTPPAAGTGVQLQTKNFSVDPGQELFRCYHTELPVDSEIFVAGFESLMAGGSHHFILFRADGDTAPLDTLTEGSCAGGLGQNWVYSSGQPHYGFDMPAGVAMPFGTRQRVVLDMHYINTSSTAIDAQVTVNLKFAKGQFERAAPLISFNTSINIPPNGMQTVSGDCTPGEGAKFFSMSTHTHKRGILATVHRLLPDGQLGEEFVHSTDWEKPQLAKWSSEPFLTFQPGEKIRYSCTYQNDRATAVRVGSSAETNEMCMAVGYFFPATARGSCN